MKNSKRGSFVPFLISIIALLAVGGGLYLYENRKSESPVPTIYPPEASYPTVPVPAAVVPAGGLQTYTDPKSGASFEYPVSWTFQKFSCNADGVAFCPASANPIGCGMTCSISPDANASVAIEARAVIQSPSDIALIDDRYQAVYQQMLASFHPANSPAIPTQPAMNDSDFPGMKEYTDKNFGFSFWYPASWTLVENDPAVASALAKTYAGGTIAKSMIVSSASSESGISISEFSSDSRSIRDNSNCGPADNCPSSIQYYFDTGTHAWMKESDFDYGPNYHEPPAFAAADISKNSMGGLHVFQGNARFADNVIVPLSARHFLIVSNVAAGTNQIRSLANTITALDPAVAVPASAADQVAAIRTEGFLYGELGRRVGDIWYVYEDQVYDSQGNLLPGARGSSFRVYGTYSDGSVAPGDFATDGTRVWSGYYAKAAVVQDADPATFTLIKQQYQIPYAQSSGLYGQSFSTDDTTYQKDRSHVWDDGRLIPGADPKTFVVTGNTHQENASGGYTMAHDAYHSYGEDKSGNVTIDGVTVGD